MIDIKRRKLWDKLISLLIWVLKKLLTIMAIVFSSITLYYQFFWKSCDINALVTGKLLDKECSQLEDAFTIDVAFMNNGNQLCNNLKSIYDFTVETFRSRFYLYRTALQ